MPVWAQAIGEILPNTHYLRVVRGLMLKGANVSEIIGEVMALAIVLVVIATVAVSRYRQTLD